MDTMKTCFKCGVEQPRHEFYKHPKMGDGLLGKCKSCTRADVRQHRRDPRYRDNVLAYDRLRGDRRTQEQIQKRRDETPLANTARSAVNNAVRDGRLFKPNRCEHCGKADRLHGHHHDYSKPFAVVWLCVACHRQHHAMMDLIERALSANEKSA